MTRALALAVLLTACRLDGGAFNEAEVITAVQLTFMPASGTAVVAEFDDPDGDGGSPGTAQPITLADAVTYTLTVRFLNRLGTIEEDITLEVKDEDIHHQVFLTGSAIAGPATTNPTAPLTHSYGDTDANGFPVGLTNTIVAATGTGQLVVTLRHMPPELPPMKSAETATTVATGSFSAIGGSTDAQVSFPVTVQQLLTGGAASRPRSSPRCSTRSATRC